MSGYNLKGACLDADDIVVNNELITVRAVEDYFANDVSLDASAKNEKIPSNDDIVETTAAKEELVEAIMAPGEPALDLKDFSISAKEPDRPTSLPLSKPGEEVAPSSQQPEGSSNCAYG